MMDASGPNLTAAGYTVDGTSVYTGVLAHYWSKTAAIKPNTGEQAVYAVVFRNNSADIHVDNLDIKSIGFTTRCINKN